MERIRTGCRPTSPGTVPPVAELDGPWAVDMHLGGPNFPYIDGKETGERAVAFAALTNQNKNGNKPFPTDGTRFAVGFSAVMPTASALNVNLDAEGLAAYEYMIQNDCTVYYRGSATWAGDQAGPMGLRAWPRGTTTGVAIDAGNGSATARRSSRTFR